MKDGARGCWLCTHTHVPRADHPKGALDTRVWVLSTELGLTRARRAGWLGRVKRPLAGLLRRLTRGGL